MSSQKAYFVLCLAARTAVSYFEIIKHTLSHHHMLLALWVGPKDGTLWLEEFATNIRHRGIFALMDFGCYCDPVLERIFQPAGTTLTVIGSLFLQLIIAAVLYKCSGIENAPNSLVWQLFWYNPVHVFFCPCSFLSSTRYLAISLLIFAATKKYRTALLWICVTGVVYLYPELLILAPSLYSLLLSTENLNVAEGRSENNDTTVARYYFKSISNICNSFTLVILAFYLAANGLNTVLERFEFNFQPFQSSTIKETVMAISSAIKFLIDRCNIDISSLSMWASIFGGHDHSYHHKSYQPAAGVLWYLDAQMLPAYELYFEVLMIMQPLLAATIIWVTMRNKYPLITVHLTVLIIFMWRRDTTLLDLSFAMSLLLSHIEVIAKMKNLLLITIGIIVPTVLSPLMLHLWVIKGTGNANYLFFQGLCHYLFITLGVVEFIKVLDVLTNNK